MGYEPVPLATSEIQELKYAGEVSTSKVVDTAADLVILHSELDRIGGLVTGAIQERYRNMILRDILEARNDLSDTLDGTLRRSVTCTLRRLTSKTPQQFVSPKHQQLELHPSQALAPPPLPPRTHELQQQKSVHLPLPVTRISHASLEKRSESQLSSNGRRSSAPQLEQQEPKTQPPPSPLTRNLQSEQSTEFEAPPNSKNIYSKVDKTVDKSQGRGIDSVDPAKYFVYPDGAPGGADVGSASANVPCQQKSGSIPIDPLNLPEPAFDAHDLEMFHQEEAHTPEYYASSHLSMFIDARSADFSGFSGPDLDDHLTFRSDHSGHMGLSESEKGTVHDEGVKPGVAVQQPCNADQEETCTSNNNFGVIHVEERVEDVVYEDVKLRITPSSGASFTVGEDPSADTEPATCTQTGNPPQEQQIPVLQSQRKSATEIKVLRQLNDEQQQQRPYSMSERPPMPVPRTRSNQNLLAARTSLTPPSSPGHVSKPHIKPRRTSPKTNTASIVASDKSSMDNTVAIHQFQVTPTTTVTTDCDTATLSHITSIDSYSKSEQESLPSEALNSLESSSPNPSIESSPCMSSKSDPCHSTSPDNASSACSGDIPLTFTEKSLGSYVSVDITTKVKDQQQTVSTSLENLPIRQRSHAFSSKSVKSDKLVSEASKSPKDGQLYDDSYVQGSTDISNATPCWYCTNLITSEICDVCGNTQKEA